MNKKLLKLVFLIFVLTTLTLATQATAPSETKADEGARLLRFPAVYNNQVVFSYAGDLYTVGTEGGVARKLTNHSGYEMFPRFSPDGKYIAFTAQYDGNTEVYLMDAQGSVPKRLTYTATLGRDDVSDRMGPNNLVMGWTPDNKHIVFRSRMIEHNDFNGQLFLTTIDGDLHTQLPLPRGGFCSYSPDGSKLAFNRIFREFRTWKRYRGGMADDIWIYDFKTKETKQITKNKAQDIIPMWKGDNIYFLSDRGPYERMNLYVYNMTSGKEKRLTEFKEYDIKFPSLGKSAIAFENGGYIYLFDTGSGKLSKLNVQIREDRLGARGGIKKVGKRIRTFDISPDGKRALFGARGEIFTVPAKYGNTRNLSNTSGVHERNPMWSPNGEWIAYVSDKTGEYEIYIQSQDGKGEPIQVTNGAGNYIYEIMWSPDSKKILWGDKKLRVRYVDIDKKTITEVHQSQYWEIRSYSWSPDSKWITFADQQASGMGKVLIYSVDKGKTYPVTDEWYDSSDPVFSKCGKYLLFVSSRDYNPTLGESEFNHIYQDMQRVYMITLAKDTPSPFLPKSDETGDKPDAPQKAAPTKGKKAKKAKGADKTAVNSVTVDLDGLSERILALPVKPARYFGIFQVKNNIYYIRRGTKDSKPMLMMYNLDKRKESQLGSLYGYALSADNKKMLVADRGNYAIINIPVSKFSIKETLDLSKMEATVCLKCEWKNIFNECWRQMRDFFYVENMHGIDWEKMRKRYEPLLKYVNHRNDLTYIIGEMIGELTIGHSYAGGGERPPVNRIPMGLLGAKLERDAATGYYRIKKILKGQNWERSLVSPLTVMGVNASEGEYIVAVDGKSTAKMKNIYQALVNTVGKQVRLKLNAKPSETGGHEETVVPIGSEHTLYYYNWVMGNIEKVNKATNGKVGYVHIPDMGIGGLNAFSRLFYPQVRKKALIVDVRGNGGGFVSPLIAERLRREIIYMEKARNTKGTTDPAAMIYGPKVCLLNEFSASDGDIFPYRFKKYKLGKLIGKRSWGGVVGIRGTLPLIDGGVLNRPEFAPFSEDGKKWLIEGVGVSPDIFVDNDPAKEFAGIDQQLDRAIKEILEELKTKEKNLPAPPPEPDKSIKKK
jgi:tricorn protease